MESDSLSCLTLGDGYPQIDFSAAPVSHEGPTVRPGLRGRPGRVRRPRSSPERPTFSGTFEPLRPRSPSASSGRHRPPSTGINSRIPLGAGEAYFSMRPPAAPAQLVLAGEPPSDGCHLPERLLRLMKLQNPNNSGLNSDGDEEIHPQNQSEPKFLDFSLMQRYSISSDLHGYTKNKLSRRECIRHILYNLISDLPLPLTTVSSTFTMSSKRQSLPPMSKVRKYPAPKSLQDQALTGRQKNGAYVQRCSIAVQARAHPTRNLHVFKELPRKSGSTDTRNSNASPDRVENEDWVGGVRALRDSHVRLVLRQLRHIHRLNRALDRVSKFTRNKSVHDKNM